MVRETSASNVSTCLDSTDYEEFLVCSMTEGEPCA